ncbi:helix-turn-helix domain-containing protein [Enterococcus plantarum]|uniref:helix-turn-helix domain-containing protein n=1 Tax=Enterococcus plantarum TaxID=1077675 RepID=UPI001A8F410E|nr:helix-turn-helix transcriptional regulator [Enterococcus plantarum]MBO0423816.1 helix-turn-helix transcriptional regulator [Enterococcus plantarum]
MAKNIKLLIEEKGIKKVHIAKLMGIRPETLSRKLKNPETFNAPEMAELSEILQTDVREMDFNVIFFTDKLESNSSFGAKKTKQTA